MDFLIRRSTRFIVYGVFLLLVLLTSVEGYDPVVSGQTMKSAGLMVSNGADGERSESTSPVSDGKREIVGLVRQYSRIYGVDSRLILAIIQQESGFNHEAMSDKGAVGVMQLMPVTNDEVMQAIDLADVPPTAGNIRAGIYYFSRLFELFNGYPREEQIRFALAAYNAGPARIYDAQELAAYIGENPRSWSAIQHILPLLSKRYYSLHQATWSEGHPRCGYFGSWKQTVAYVDIIMKAYQQSVN
jgi:membrane-bound lytic murein transglycosylase MltF